MIAPLIVVPTAIAAYLTTPTTYWTEWRTSPYFDADALWRVLLSVLALSIGALIVSLRHRQRVTATWPVVETPVHVVLRRWFTITLRLALLGYTVWFLLAIERGITLTQVGDVLAGRSDVVYHFKSSTFATVAGVTTLSQLAIAAVCIGALLWHSDRTVRRPIALLLLLAGARAVVFSERLALLELLIPLFVVLAQRRGRAAPRKRPAWVRLGPFLAVPILILGFSLTEIPRSYSHKEHRESALAYGALRFEGYYAMSYNNAALLWHELRNTPGRLPFQTLGAFWTVPVLDNFINYESASGFDFHSSYKKLLSSKANPEFNNSGGITAPTFDWGFPGGLAVLFAAGMILGVVFDSFTKSRPIGLLLYPMLFTGLLELPRIWYWSSGRVIVPTLALILCAYQAGRSSPHSGVGNR